MSDPATPPAAPSSPPPAVPPAAPAAAPPAAPPSGDPPSADPWWGKPDLGLDQETANFYAGRNTSSLAEALKTGMHAFKTAQDRNVLPKPDPAKLGEWSGWKDLGWTEQRADYKVDSPKSVAPQGYPYNDKLEGTFLDAAHELRIPPAQAKELLHKVMAQSYGEYSALESAYARDLQQSTDALKGEWGGKYDANKALAERAFKAFAPDGMDMALLSEVMSSAGVVRMFAKIGEAFGEEKLVQPGGGGQFGARSATTIQAELDQIAGDPAQVNILMDARHPRHRELNEKRNKLLEELSKVKPR